MEITNRKKKYIVIAVAAVFLICIAVVVWAVIKKHGMGAGNRMNGNKNDAQLAEQTAADDYILVDIGDYVRRLYVSSGAIGDGDLFDYGSFSKFSGFPKNSGDGEVAALDTAERQAIVSTGDGKKYLCDGKTKTCQPSDILDKKYSGLLQDAAAGNGGTALVWFAWNAKTHVLWGHVNDPQKGDSSPAYACDTQTLKCQVTAGYDSFAEGSARANIPNGSMSPSRTQFVMIDQHDAPNEQTGDRWELQIYASNDLKQPPKTYDISPAIDRDENVAYDSVQSVAWSRDEKHLAIGTARHIYTLDLDSGSLALAYSAEAIDDEDNTLFWDTAALAFSPDGRYILFADYSGDTQADDAGEVDSADLLERIDLKNNNDVSELLQADSVSLDVR